MLITLTLKFIICNKIQNLLNYINITSKCNKIKFELKVNKNKSKLLNIMNEIIFSNVRF